MRQQGSVIVAGVFSSSLSQPFIHCAFEANSSVGPFCLYILKSVGKKDQVVHQVCSIFLNLFQLILNFPLADLRSHPSVPDRNFILQKLPS